MMFSNCSYSIRFPFKFTSSWIFTLVVLLVGCSNATLSKDECLIADWKLIGFGDGSSGKSNTQINKHREACNKHAVNPDKELYDQGYAEGNAQFCTEDRGYSRATSGYSSHSVCLNIHQYMNGYDRGVLDYCHYDRGYENASRGQVQEKICTAVQPYLTGYSQGIALYCNYDKGYELGLNSDPIQSVCPTDLEEGFLLGYEQGQYVSQLFSDLENNKNAIKSLNEEREQLQIKILDTKNKIAYNEALTSDDRVQLLNQLDRFTEREEQVNQEITQANKNISDIQYELGVMGVSY